MKPPKPFRMTIVSSSSAGSPELGLRKRISRKWRELFQVYLDPDKLDAGNTPHRLYGLARRIMNSERANVQNGMKTWKNVITPERAAIVYPAILGHPSPELHACNRETMIAEKFEAMAKLGELNSRMKDFFDVWCWPGLANFAIRSILRPLNRRFLDVAPVLVADPICFTEEFAMNSAKTAQWAAFLRRNTFTDVPDSFSSVIKFLADFLRALIEKQPLNSIWEARGPWSGHESSGYSIILLAKMRCKRGLLKRRL